MNAQRNRFVFRTASAVDKAFERDNRLQSAFHALYDLVLRQSNGERSTVVAHVFADTEHIFALFEYIGIVYIVKRSEIIFAEGERDKLAPAGEKLACFFIGAQRQRRLPEPAAGRFDIALNDLPARHASVIDNEHTHAEHTAGHAVLCIGYCKIGVRKPVAEGVYHLFRFKCLKIAITDIYIFAVEKAVFAIEIFICRVAFAPRRYRIRKPAGGAFQPADHIRGCPSALHAAVPDDHHGIGRGGFELRHIHNAAHVKNDRDTRKRTAKLRKRFEFGLGKHITAAAVRQIAVLAGYARYHEKRGFVPLCQVRNKLILQGRLLLR